MNMIRQPVWFCLKRCSLSLQPIQAEGSSPRGRGGHQQNTHTHAWHFQGLRISSWEQGDVVVALRVFSQASCCSIIGPTHLPFGSGDSFFCFIAAKVNFTVFAAASRCDYIVQTKKEKALCRHRGEAQRRILILFWGKRFENL